MARSGARRAQRAEPRTDHGTAVDPLPAEDLKPQTGCWRPDVFEVQVSPGPWVSGEQIDWRFKIVGRTRTREAAVDLAAMYLRHGLRVEAVRIVTTLDDHSLSTDELRQMARS